ncbi:serine/threonine transporter SstT [Kurthia sibirica]|uniref:Serine/threonine transporter SstT n=1 Tax=Kurthia sibirica TaxID=202750 RepID=A0A2U3ANK8_9BACL|nr:serine/threonine transporter SstT [Kurthia sibirica]PWI26105.1 serine/threonine transporter SstT [Kurthia sibirica]GEK34943.1 serine/threonine transporter SstT [Kurthia sibirica]
MSKLIKKWNDSSLVGRIIVGIIIGVILAVVAPKASAIAMLGTLFISALKAVAPILVFVLVLQAISSHTAGTKTNMKTVLVLYAVGTLLAGTVGVIASKLFPVKLTLKESVTDIAPPQNVWEVMQTLLQNIVANPVDALLSANYIGILAWAIVLGFAFKKANDSTKTFINNSAEAVTKVVQWVISLAPIGIVGIVFDAISSNGFNALKEYGTLIIILVGSMLFIALVVNPLIVFVATRRNPYPLVFTTIKESGITAFFTRSSGANIPINMRLSEKLGLNKDTYAVSIPLGATINMAGAAVTISVLTLSAAYTLNINVDIPTAIILMVVAAVSAAGASGVPGGSLLLIPLACGLIGIPADVAMQIIGVGYVISVVQDSFETALNSSSDVVFTAAAEYANERKEAVKN